MWQIVGFSSRWYLLVDLWIPGNNWRIIHHYIILIRRPGCWVERGIWVSWGKDVPKSRTMEWGGWKVRGTERRGARCRGVEEGTTRVEKRVFSDGFVWACSWIFLCLHWEAEMRCEQSKRSRNPQLGHRFWKHNWTFKLKQERCWWSFYAGDKMLAFLAGAAWWWNTRRIIYILSFS